MLRKHVNPETGKSEWALMSVSKPGKVLQYFGEKKPSEEVIASAERRVEYFKHLKGKK